MPEIKKKKYSLKITDEKSGDKLYSNKLYPSKVLHNLNMIKQSDKFCDVKIVAGGTVVKAHRVVLSASSPYFHAMFCNGLVEEQLDSIELHSFPPHILDYLINFIYTGEIVISQENVQELMVSADMLELNEVVIGCTEFLKQELHTSNAVGIYRFAKGHNCEDLAKSAFSFILSNFPRMSLEEEYFDLPKDDLCDILASELLQVDGEIQVFEAAMHWIKYDLEQRTDLDIVCDVLEHVRLPLIPLGVLYDAISNCTNTSLKDALSSIMEDLILKKGILVPMYVSPRLCAKKDIFVIGGSKRERISTWTRSCECTFESVERFDTYSGKWSRASPMSFGRILPGVAALNGRIYVVGGEEESRILANGESYNPSEDTWETVPSMIVPRCEFGLCALNGVLYAIGGWVGDDIGASIERYDPLLNEWELHGNMPEPRFSMGVVSYEGLIYLVGGFTDHTRHVQKLTSFNPVTGEWSHLAPMLVPRSQMGVAVLDGYLYVVGGTNKCNDVLQSVERYSFEHNCWSEVPPMKVPRGSPAVAAASSCLYVIGGDQTYEVNFYRGQVTIASVERYDPRTNMWYDDCPPLSESRSEAGAVVI